MAEENNFKKAVAAISAVLVPVISYYGLIFPYLKSSCISNYGPDSRPHFLSCTHPPRPPLFPQPDPVTHAYPNGTCEFGYHPSRLPGFCDPNF